MSKKPFNICRQSNPTVVNAVSEVAFHKKVYEILNRQKITKPKPIQSYTWSSILRGCSVFLINSAQTGKTMAYLPAIFTKLMDSENRFNNLPNVIGPIAIILCSKTNKIEEIYHYVQSGYRLSDVKKMSALVVPPIDKNCLVSIFMLHQKYVKLL